MFIAELYIVWCMKNWDVCHDEWDRFILFNAMLSLASTPFDLMIVLGFCCTSQALPAPIIPEYRKLSELFVDIGGNASLVASRVSTFNRIAQDYIDAAAKSTHAGRRPKVPGGKTIEMLCGDPPPLFNGSQFAPPKNRGDDDDTVPPSSLFTPAWSEGKLPMVPGGDGNVDGVAVSIGFGFDVATGERKAAVAPPVTFRNNKSFYDANSLRHLSVPDAIDVAVECSSCFQETEISPQ